MIEHDAIYTAIGIAAAILCILGSMNIFFIKKLVTKVEEMSESMPVQQNEIKNMGQKINEMEREFRDLAKNLNDLVDLKQRVAIVEYALSVKKKGKNSANLSQ